MSTLQINEINKNNVVTIDFETYYGDKYSLTDKAMNTSEYVRDERFKVHLVGIKIGQQPTKVYSGDESKAALQAIDWTQHALLCQNTAFDGFILTEHYGIIPAVYLDTLSMSRAVNGPAQRHGLAYIAPLFGFAGKVRAKALSDTKNIRDLDPSSELYKSLSEYCVDDVEDTCGVFWKMYDSLTDNELQLIDITIRGFCDPVLLVDTDRVQAELDREVAEKIASLLISGVKADTLSSANKFADELRKLGVEPPTKISKTTGKEAYAFASTDRGLMALQNHEDIRVRNLVEARLRVKSTIGETRAQRFLKAGENGAKLPILLNYCGAHTFRWSGGNKMNLQNLPRGGELRRSLLAPPGHVVVVSDSAQIEARLNAWLSDELGLLDVFRAYDAGEGPDAYRIMAAALYNIPVNQVTDEQRFVGKVCLAEGSLVYSSRGWVPIETITTDDKLWDGEEWVCHSGLAMNGTKQTLNVSGLYMTPDHQVLCGTEWKEARYLEQDKNTLSQALGTGAVSWLLLGTSKGNVAESQASSSSATATSASTLLTDIISKISRVQGALVAHDLLELQNDTGGTPKLCQTTNIVDGCSIDSLQPKGDVTTSQTQTTFTTVNAEYTSMMNGVKTAHPFSYTYKGSTDGTTPTSKWTESMSTKGMSLVTSDSFLEVPTLQTSEESQISKKKSVVYDILSVGPRNRFLALTSKGPVVVHNCVLALGYGMGEQRLKDTLETGAMGPAITLPDIEYLRAKNTYRFEYRHIAAMWKKAQGFLHRMVLTPDNTVGFEYKCLQFGKDWVRLPNGMFLRYPELSSGEDGMSYRTLDGHARIYGGLFVENLVQALARVIIADQMLAIHRAGYRIVTMTHDEIVVVCPAEQAEQCKADMTRIMSTPPEWAPTLPLSVKCEYDTCYSK
jgi:hypothetical protein